MPVTGAHRAVHLVGLTTLDFDLNGRMGDAEIPSQHLRHSLEHLLTATHALLGHHDRQLQAMMPELMVQT